MTLRQDETGNSTAGIGEVIIAKNRGGSLDTVQLRFIGKYTKFSDLDAFYAPSPTPMDRPLPPQATNPIASFEQKPAGTVFKSRANDRSTLDYRGPGEEPPF